VLQSQEVPKKFRSRRKKREEKQIPVTHDTVDSLVSYWSSLSLPLPRERHTICTIDNGRTVVLFGGISNQKLRLNDVWFLDTSTLEWREAKLKALYHSKKKIVDGPSSHPTSLSSSAPSPRYNHSLVAVNSKLLILFGGRGTDFMNDVWSLHIDEDDFIEWKQISTSNVKVPNARYNHSACMISNKMLVFGGISEHQQFNDLWIFDVESYRWKELITHDPNRTDITPRHGQQVCISNKYMYCYGGVHKQHYSEKLYKLNMESMVWEDTVVKTGHEGHVVLPPGRVSHIAVPFDNGKKMFIMGGIIGYNEQVSRSNDTWILDLEDDVLNSENNYNIAFVHEQHINDFVVKKVLGSGGQGIVMLVYDERRNIELAMKRTPLDFSENGNERAVTSMDAFTEILIHQQLKHKNVLATESFFLEKNGERLILNVLMPYCNMGDLQQLYKTKRQKWHTSKLPSSIDEKEIIDWTIQLAEGLEYIHSKNIIHRDIKPQNCFISCPSGAIDVTLKLADFGMAKHVTESKAKTICGTLHFMGPELYNDDCYDLSADIWSMGCMLFWLFVGVSVDFKMEIQRKRAEAQWSTLQIKCREKMWDIISSCVSFDPNARPTAIKLLSLLQQVKQDIEETSSEEIKEVVQSPTSALSEWVEEPHGVMKEPITNNEELLDISLSSTYNPTIKERDVWTDIQVVIMKLEQAHISSEEADLCCDFIMNKNENMLRFYLAANELYISNEEQFMKQMTRSIQRLIKFEQNKIK
jgi:serine/threonine protein kinase